MKWAAVVLAMVMAAPAGAYYHYLHYPTRTSGTGFPEKFDLNALPNKTVTVFVSDSAPTAYAANDSFASVLSQLRQATIAWNSVDSSDLRVAFGGLIQGNASPNNPGIKVVFDEVPPGLIAFTSKSTSTSLASSPTGAFYPLLQTQVTFRRDLSTSDANVTGPSFGSKNLYTSAVDGFFTSAVHEFGHALGLQHSFTSSAMTVSVNRNINRSRPIDADDIAGLSQLYPKAGYSSTVGAITGRVTVNGQPMAFASVVALRPAGPAISSITNPDGTYRIDGLPADTYYVYVHPVPGGGIDAQPVDLSGQPIPAGPTFAALFFPGTRDLNQFAPINVSRGGVVGGIDFAVQPRTGVLLSDGKTYSFLGANLEIAVKPAFVNSSATERARVRFETSGPTPVPQSASVLGVGNLTVLPYDSPQALALYFPSPMPLGAGTGPRHLVLNYGTDMFVLPSAVNIVSKLPPQNVAVGAGADGSALVTGSYLGPDSRVFFDGLPANTRVPFSGSDAGGAIIVTPPSGASGQRATVSVFNADGQSSIIMQSQNPPVFAYPVTDAPQIAPTVSSLPAGQSAMVEINAVNTNFVDGHVTVGFGTQDIFVRRVWVLSPTRLFVNVSVLPNANLGATEISVISGFQTIVQPFAFSTQPQNARLPNISLPIVNAQPGQANIFPGAVASMVGNNLAVSSSASISLTDDLGVAYPVQILSAGSNQITFAVPAGISTGVSVLRLNNGTDAAFPVALQIDSQPPVIAAVVNGSGQPMDLSRSVGTGEVLTLTVAGLDPTAVADRTRVRLLASGIELPITQIGAGPSGMMQIQIVITQSFGGQPVPLTISQDGTVSNAYTVVIR